MEKQIILFNIVFLVGSFIEILFLFLVPYHYFSTSLQYLKIIRVLFGIINFLFELYFEILRFVEYLVIKEESKIKFAPLNRNRYKLSDKIIIVVGFIIALFIVTYNIAGIILSIKYINKRGSSAYHSSLKFDSLLFLFENCIILICWIFFFIFWNTKIKEFREKNNNNNNNAISYDEGAPPIQDKSSKGDLKINNQKSSDI